MYIQDSRVTSALLLLSLVFPKSRACARGGVPSPVHCRLKAGALFGAALFQLISTYVRRDVHSSPREGLSGAQRMLICKGQVRGAGARPLRLHAAGLLRFLLGLMYIWASVPRHTWEP